MGSVKEFCKRKNIVISAKRYGVDALGAMAQGLFCSLLIGTILNTLGTQLGLPFLVTVGGYASAMSGAAMAVAIGYALHAPPLVLFSLVTVGSPPMSWAPPPSPAAAGPAAPWRCSLSPSSPPSWARPCPRRPRSTSWSPPW